MSRMADIQVHLFASSDALLASASELMRRLDAGAFAGTVLRLPRPLERLAWDNRTGTSMKLPRVLWWARALRRCAALVAAERTSAQLKYLPGRDPPMIHLRHGAGDRAVGFERRIALYDALVVAGEKDRERTLAAGRLPPERCHVAGYVKLEAIRRLRAGVAPLFDNGRPTVLYNPHFSRELGSWHPHGAAVVEAIRAAGDFNLVLAPHVRLFATTDAAGRARWEALAEPGRVIVDLGSARSLDMTYTLGADIYLGDVSSQVYEFVAEPRPCVFLNSHRVAWADSADYRMWHMGEVIDTPDDVVAALRRAAAAHARYRPVQQQFVAEALGRVDGHSAERAAMVIRSVMRR